MKFAFIILGKFCMHTDRAAIKDGAAQIVGVADVEEACRAAAELRAGGVDCIELCGAFGEAGAKRVIEATENQIPVGYITHLPEQDEIYRRTFSKKG